MFRVNKPLWSACALIRKNGDVHVFYVDFDDYELVRSGTWLYHRATRTKTAYVIASQSTGGDLLHRRLVSAPKGVYVDHINGNGLDNRRCNLRLCSASQSNGNTALRKDNKSGFKGVCWYKGAWVASISFNKRQIYLGRFSSREGAHSAYREAASRLFKEFANFGSFPPGGGR